MIIEQDYVELRCDSQSAIHFAKNQVDHARTKHIDVCYHFVWDVEDDDVSLLKVHTNENPSNMLTKVVTESKFHHFLDCSRLARVDCPRGLVLRNGMEVR